MKGRRRILVVAILSASSLLLAAAPTPAREHLVRVQERITVAGDPILPPTHQSIERDATAV